MVTAILTMLFLFTVIYLFLLIWYLLDCSHPSSHPIATIATDGAAGVNAPGNATLVNGRLRRPLSLLYGFIPLFVSYFFSFFMTYIFCRQPSCCMPPWDCELLLLFLLYNISSFLCGNRYVNTSVPVEEELLQNAKYKENSCSQFCCRLVGHD